MSVFHWDDAAGTAWGQELRCSPPPPPPLYPSRRLWNRGCWLCCHIGVKKAPNWAKLQVDSGTVSLDNPAKASTKHSICFHGNPHTHAHNASWKRRYRLLAQKDFIIPAFFPAPAIIFSVWIHSWVTSGELLSTAALQIRPLNWCHLGLFSWSFKLGCWWIDTNYPLLYVAMLACSCLFFFF